MKRILRTLWNLTGPIRRPFRKRFERLLTDCLARALETSELSLVLDALVAEQFRLMEKVDGLQNRLDEITTTVAHDDTY